MAPYEKRPVLEMRKVSKSFARPSGEPLAALKDINVVLHDGEIQGLLGRSGSGKSTLLRLAAGLAMPTSGQVLYRGQQLTGPEEGIAVVFQTFALMPWLTVLENVEPGLDALGASREEARRRAMSAIDLIGLDGFQSAYPREISGGMRQRVGFARALVVRPAVLLMDEPFSALDVLTAETLRTDFMDLWVEHQLPIKSVLVVTHNIDEAIIMCDRVLVLASGPGRIEAEILIPLGHPRDRLDPEFHNLVDECYSILTSRARESIQQRPEIHGGLVRLLPDVSAWLIGAAAETISLEPFRGQADLATIARLPSLIAKDVFAVAEALHILEFAELKDAQIKLTVAGGVFAQSDPEERKRLFGEHLLAFAPFAAHIRHVLDEREGHTAPRVRFESELEDHLSETGTETTLRTAIAWGRFAEIFVYDDETKKFSLNH
jgi:NitT/TauT family transport system ATP-binding protein